MAKPALERLPYFKFYAADYLLDTLHFKAPEQHGAYLLLMIHYYWNGSLPIDRPELYALALSTKGVVDPILARYFHEENGRLIHHRVEREMRALGDLVRSNSKAGKKSGEVRRAKAKEKKPATTQLNGKFEEFWQQYPLHKNRAQAEKAWLKLNPDDALIAKILAASLAYKSGEECTKEGGKYITHAWRWITQRRWEDQPGTQHADDWQRKAV